MRFGEELAKRSLYTQALHRGLEGGISQHAVCAASMPSVATANALNSKNGSLNGSFDVSTYDSPCFNTTSPTIRVIELRQ